MDSPIFFADGTVVPELMVESELIKFLRLEELNVANPKNTIRYYRDRGYLVPTRIANRNAYSRRSVLEFLEKLTRNSDKKT